MEKLRKTIYISLSIVTVIVAVGSVLSVFRDTESGVLKMLDFPRIQFFFAALVTLPLFALFTQKWRWYDYALIVGLLGGLVINTTYLIHYTPLVAKRVADAVGTDVAENRVSLLLANVKMSNRKAQPLLDLVSEVQPDLLLVMEVDGWWGEQLKPIRSDYPHVQESINEVAYGMTLYGKFPFKRIETNYLNNEKVPSFEGTITLENGRNFDLYAMHPVPPTNYKELPDNEGQQEVALEKVGRMIENSKRPAIIAGDLNDVVWSYTDELTGTEDLLHDVRVGRGFYNSYNADYFFMRWPIDHVFVTREFRLQTLERMGHIGSDHFPIYVELILER